MSGKKIVVELDEFYVNIVIKHLPYILKGFRGSSSRKKRIRIKKMKKAINVIVKNYIKEQYE